LVFLWAQKTLEKTLEETRDLLEEKDKSIKEKDRKLGALLTRIKGLKVQASRPSLPSSLSPKLLRDLILLCHPDKHQGSERATKVTSYLLNLRIPQKREK
jgi:hypothetical protein